MTDGERLFARYAYAPNYLGYCGPAQSAALRRLAAGGQIADAAAIARQFSGVWPYSVILAEMLGIDDPLDERVQRAYWTGSPLLDRVDNREFGARLLQWIGNQAGHYWNHLTAGLIAEVRPTHTFHVLGVYPWSRLLATGLPEPVRVLDSCRITPAVVTSVEPEVRVRRSRLGYRDGRLVVLDETDEPVAATPEQGCFVRQLAIGDIVAVHWDAVCDRLAPDDAQRLSSGLDEQLDLTNARLANDPPR